MPCVLLILVALSQIYITQTNGLLTPAKGGGFGMFSTVDKLNNRVVIVSGVFDKREVKIKVNTNDPFFKKFLEKEWQKARAYPSNSNLRELGKTLGKLKLSKTPDYIKIQVKKCVFDNQTASIAYETVNELSMPYRQTRK